jgi:hypothetical protein
LRESALMVVANHTHGKLENRHWYEHIEVTRERAERRCHSCVPLRSTVRVVLSKGGSFVFAVKISRGQRQTGCLLLLPVGRLPGHEWRRRGSGRHKSWLNLAGRGHLFHGAWGSWLGALLEAENFQIQPPTAPEWP